jgi:hypothetical protein
VIELPLVFMDANLVEGEDGYLSFKNLFGHLEKIGGERAVPPWDIRHSRTAGSGRSVLEDS